MTTTTPQLEGYHRTEAEFPELTEHTPFSVAWYETWRRLHLERYPDCDQSTRDNLAMFVDMARARDELAATYEGATT